MKKSLVFTLVFMLLVSFLAATNGNLFWVTSVEGTPASFLNGPAKPVTPNIGTFPVTEKDPTEWAVFATQGKYNLNGSSFIKPENEANPRGKVGTNATTTIDGNKPVILGGGEDSVILPCCNFYFGPGASPSQLVGGANGGEKGLARLKCLKENAKILKSKQTFYNPSTMVLNFPSAPTFPNPPANLPTRGSTETSSSYQTIRITESGYYTKISTGWGHALEFLVGANDLVIRTDELVTKGTITVTRTGNGNFFLFCGTGDLDSNDSIFSVDIGNSHTIFSFTTLTLKNRLNLTNVQPQGAFSLHAEDMTITNSVSSFPMNNEDMVMSFDTLKINGSSDWEFSHSSESTPCVFVFVSNGIDVSAGTTFRFENNDKDYIHVFYEGLTTNLKYHQFFLDGSVYLSNSDIDVTGSASLHNILTKGTDVKITGAASVTGTVFSPVANVDIGGSALQIGAIVTGGTSVKLHGGLSKPGCIWVPNAEAEIKGGVDFHGTFIAKNFTLTGNSNIKYTIIQRPDPTIPYPNSELPVPPEFNPPPSAFLIAAVDNDGYNPRGVYTSTDGVTWTKRPNGQYEMYGPRSVTGSNSVYVIAGLDGYGKFGSSPDGITWTPLDIGYSNIFRVRWLNGRFIAVGEVGDGGICVSTDGTSWDRKSTYGYGELRDVAWGDGLYLAIGAKDSNGIYYSQTGGISEWYYKNNKQNINGLAYGNGVFVAVGQKKIQTITKSAFLSNNNWSDRSPSGNYTLNSIAWNGSIFVAIGNGGVIYTSSDGISWTKRASPTSNKLFDVQWVPSISCFYVGGNNIILNSSDGMNWTATQPKNTDGTNINSNFRSIFGR
jgi:hypothetical protein